MKSKLGVYLITLGAMDVVDYFGHAQPRIAVSMDHNPDTWRAIKQCSPNTFVIGRYYVDDPEQLYEDDPEGRAEKFFNRLRPEAEKMRGLNDAWMSYNEIDLGTDDGSAERARRYSRFHVRWGDLMKAAGLVSCAYSFATGTPAKGDPRKDNSLEPNLWPYLVEGLKHCDLLSLHEYSSPRMQDLQGWLCLRYRSVWNLLPVDARRQIVITECGIDGGPSGHPQEGWSKFTTEAGYLASLQWYDAELQKDDNVIGATIFTADPWGIDGSFGIGQLKQIRDYMAQGGSPAPVVVKPPTAGGTVVEPVKKPGPAEGPVTPTEPTGQTYTVQSGDTLFKIARQFGVTVDALVAANNMPNRNLIRVGQVLQIPPKAAPPVAMVAAVQPTKRKPRGTYKTQSTTRAAKTTRPKPLSRPAKTTRRKATGKASTKKSTSKKRK